MSAFIRLLRLAVFMLAATHAAINAVASERINIVAAELQDTGDGALAIKANTRFELGSRLEEAVNRGVVLYFALDFEMRRRRWYWFDENVAQANRAYRISYNALIREYRVSYGGLQQRFQTLDQALRSIGAVRAWRVLEQRVLTPGEKYEVAVRLRLDVSQLPKPFQISAITNNDWNPEADWFRFRYLHGQSEWVPGETQ